MFAFALSLPVMAYLLMLARLEYPPHGPLEHLKRLGLGLLWGSAFAFLSFYVDRALVVSPQPGPVFVHSLLREYLIPLLWIAGGWYLLRRSTAADRTLAPIDAGGFAVAAAFALILDRGADAVAFAGIYDAFLYPLIMVSAGLAATRLLPLPSRMQLLPLTLRAAAILALSVVSAGLALLDLRGLPLVALIVSLGPAALMIAATEIPPERFRIPGP